ncbi:relaxase/mobilization nuclease domain-containing protein [Hymenobacter latericus]|uniref:relaxase/mobilization nuclease domain-containing protein n=1 Tax=Hymenobacter sp. YIM 151858-1 TaxID=2987688 RepID=UPI002225D4DC|nr:relaxase/mobilization nuclease domain-containing protein [Hymenobacter sp. YIM 151858-1]UYZ61219.1 relaxase/mobilization nuclease domain-containing protein [Hymenobacter sp. YIM 151858-1]
MIAKTTIGADFRGAIAYGAGVREEEQKKKSRLLGAHNLLSRDAAGIAREMQLAAQRSGRCQLPVWHTSLSWPPEENVTPQQMLQAAALYCQKMGADLARHQVVVYQHLDRPHPHVHVYINRVPLDGGPVLRTSHNYARNVRVTAEIRAELGMQSLPRQRQGKKLALDQGPRPVVQVRAALAAALGEGGVRSVAELGAFLRARGVAVTFKRDAGGLLVGASFRLGDVALTGTQVGCKARTLRELLEPETRRAEARRVGEGLAAERVSGSAGPAPERAAPMRAGQDTERGALGALLEALEGGSAWEVENQMPDRRKRKRRRPLR